MAAPQPCAARQMPGDFAPKLVDLTDDVLVGEVGERTELICNHRLQGQLVNQLARATRAVRSASPDWPCR